MAGAILGTKREQKRMFTQEGMQIPVTVITTAPCHLIGLVPHPAHPDRVQSMKLGFGTAKNINKPQRGILEKAGIKTPLRFFREIRLDRLGITASIIETEGKTCMQLTPETIVCIGAVVNPAVFFQAGDLVHVTGTSKGKGFQGVVRRHGFKGGSKTHGQSDRLRAPGSIGSGTTPGRVVKGKRMAGRMGGETVTIQALPVIAVDESSVTVKGLVPGSVNGLLEIRSANRS